MCVAGVLFFSLFVGLAEVDVMAGPGFWDGSPSDSEELDLSESERQAGSGSSPSFSESYPMVGSGIAGALNVIGLTRGFDSFHASWKRTTISCVSFSSCAEQ